MTFTHEVVERRVRCRCGKEMPLAKFEEHWREMVREAARKVIRRALLPPTDTGGMP